jgi:hypothetical protein
VHIHQAQVKFTTFLRQGLSQGSGFARGQDAQPERPVAAHSLLKFLHRLSHWIFSPYLV